MTRVMKPLYFSSLLLLVPSVLSAQMPAASFEELSAQGLLKRGDSVMITDSTGQRTTGRLELLSKSTMSLNSGSRIRQVLQADVRQIQRRDPVTNGALIGLGVGIGAAVVANDALCDSNDPECSNIALVFIGVPVIIGSTVVGAIADLMNRKTVYRAPVAGTTTWQLGPVIAPGRTGVGFAVRF